MTTLSSDLREALAKVGTSTLTGVLNRRGLRSMTLYDVWPLRPEQPRLVGIAFTMRFIPSREDKDGPTSTNRSMVQPQAMEECPPGHVLMIDSRGDSRAASAGDLYIGRLKARGGISLADCFCIALAQSLPADVVTSDHHEFDALVPVVGPVWQIDARHEDVAARAVDGQTVLATLLRWQQTRQGAHFGLDHALWRIKVLPRGRSQCAGHEGMPDLARSSHAQHVLHR